MAVLKMSPEVRNAIPHSGNCVFLGLTNCRAFDRFWATQCRHCQKYGHTKESFPTKNTSPACGFCAGPHTSLNCTDKSVLKRVNRSSLDSPAERCHHSTSSLDCPVMIPVRGGFFYCTVILLYIYLKLRLPPIFWVRITCFSFSLSKLFYVDSLCWCAVFIFFIIICKLHLLTFP